VSGYGDSRDKHSSSNAASHGRDLDTLLSLETFAPLVKKENGSTKPVLIITADGGPDENPRHTKVIANAVTTFRKHNFDGLFVAVNAPGLSKYNRAERRMPELARATTGTVLPHDRFGNHLDSEGNTIDEELEMKNFENAGRILAEIWSSLVMDGYAVTAAYVSPDEDLPEAEEVSDLWYAEHVRESQYMLQVSIYSYFCFEYNCQIKPLKNVFFLFQIVKCRNDQCCKPFRSDLRRLLHQGFLPGPYPTRSTTNGIEVPSPDKHKDGKYAPFLLRQAWDIRPPCASTQEMPYDSYCPSVRSDIEERKCPNGGVYFASKASKERHR